MCVDTIIRETEWLEAMIDKILTWRSVAKDRDDLDMVCESVREVVEESATRFLRMVSSDEVRFKVEMGTDSPVYHDKRGLELDRAQPAHQRLEVHGPEQGNHPEELMKKMTALSSAFETTASVFLRRR